MNDLTADRPDGEALQSAPEVASTARKSPAAHKDHVPRGIFCMVAATMLFSIAFALSKWVGCTLSGRRGDVSALVLLAHRRCGGHAADDRILRVRHAAAARPYRPRSVAGDFADVLRSRFQPDAARRRGRDQFLRAALCRPGVDHLAQGTRRPRALGRAPGRLFRRAHRDQSGGEFADARRIVRAGQRDHVRQRHRRGSRHDQDGIGQYAADLADGDDHVLSQLFAFVRLASADADRRRCCYSAADSPTPAGNISGRRRFALRRRRPSRRSTI